MSMFDGIFKNYDLYDMIQYVKQQYPELSWNNVGGIGYGLEKRIMRINSDNTLLQRDIEKQKIMCETWKQSYLDMVRMNVELQAKIVKMENENVD